MLVIGDVHGCYDTLCKLLEKLPKDDICFVGDLIDRGPKSKQVVELVKSEGWDCVMGNHEKMMIDYWTQKTEPRPLYRMWEGNGGFEARMSYFEGRDKDRQYLKGEFNEKLFDEHVEWMKELPVYMQYEDIKNEDGRYLVVSHSHVANVWGDQEGSDQEVSNFIQEVLWGRPMNLKNTRNQSIYNVIGHTPQSKIKIKSFYANIDTGCFWQHDVDGMSTLTALQFPSMEVYTQKCVDDITWQPSGY